MRHAVAITLTEEERETLNQWLRGRTTPVRKAERAKIVLLAADGKTNIEIAGELGINRSTVSQWRERFAERRIEGIEKDEPRSGRKATLRDSVALKIIEVTTTELPPNATQWSTRSLAKKLDLDQNMVHRVWQANNLKPHLTRNFKVSNDPDFAEKVVDIVGLYLAPPDHALVLCVDEKSQIQALDRTQPSFPMYPGRCGTLTHDYKRNGTTTLFAALEYMEGKVIGACMPRHRHQEWLKFLKQIDRETQQDLDLHLIIDNYSTHKHKSVIAWKEKHPRFHFHFIPTSSSWLNLIERWFRDLTEKRIRRGAFHSVDSLIEAIESYIEQHNEEPQPFFWTAGAKDIIDKVKRARQVLDMVV